MDESADLTVELPVMSEEHPQDLGQGEDELPVGQPKHEPLVHVLGEQQRAFLRTRRADIERLAGEGPEVLRLAVRIRALDPCHAPGVVPAVQETLDYPADPLQADPSQAAGVVRFVARAKFGEVPLK